MATTNKSKVDWSSTCGELFSSFPNQPGNSAPTASPAKRNRNPAATQTLANIVTHVSIADCNWICHQLPKYSVYIYIYT